MSLSTPEALDLMRTKLLGCLNSMLRCKECRERKERCDFCTFFSLWCFGLRCDWRDFDFFAFSFENWRFLFGEDTLTLFSSLIVLDLTCFKTDTSFGKSAERWPSGHYHSVCFHQKLTS